MEKSTKGNIDKKLGTITATAAVITATIGVLGMVRSDIGYNNSIRTQQTQNSILKDQRITPVIEERRMHEEGNFSVALLSASSLMLLSSLYSFRLASATEIERNNQEHKKRIERIKETYESEPERFDVV
jgi:hypothetical protein